MGSKIMANGWRDWGKGIGQGIATTVVLALVPGSVVAYLAHIQSVWTLPVLLGLGAALMIAFIIGIAKAITHLPPKRIMPNNENIEGCVRAWLDNYKVAVQNDPSPETHFRLRITLDGGGHLTVLRSKSDYPDYVQIIADLGMRGTNKKLLEQFSDDEKASIFMDIKLELARAQAGYGGLVDPPENFHLFRRVPIHHNLTEFAFMSTVGALEAAMNLVGLVFLKAKHQAEQRKLEYGAMPQLETSLVTPKATSDVPERAERHLAK
jgi:hypothetical protein